MRPEEAYGRGRHNLTGLKQGTAELRKTCEWLCFLHRLEIRISYNLGTSFLPCHQWKGHTWNTTTSRLLQEFDEQEWASGDIEERRGLNRKLA